MKHIKTYEEQKKNFISTVNYSDLNSWSVDDLKTPNKPILTGTKNLDINLGQRVIDFFEDNNLFIKVGSGDWCKKQELLLPDEENFKEYRVNVGTKRNFDDWFEYEYGSDADDRTDEELQKEYENVEVDYEDSKPAWSVFLPVNVTNIEAAAMSDSSIYLKIITDAFPDISRQYIDSRRGALYDEPKGFKKFINDKNVKITNQNIELVNTINYRLYKDSKVFGSFRDEIFDGEWETKTFIEEWLKLIK